MSLRLTGGTARGRTLVPAVREGIRPTSGRVREAWFSMMGQDLSGVRFLDAFSGSGLMAFEAWSRGADVVAVERDAGAARDIQARADALGARIELLRGDVLARAASLGPFGVIYVDPPYAIEPGPVLAALAPLGGRLTLEAAEKTSVPERAAGLVKVRAVAYGSSVLHLFEPAS